MIIIKLLYLLAISIIGFTCFIIWDLYRKRHILKFAKQFPGYRFYPVIGNGYHFIGKNAFVSMQKVAGKYGTPYSFWIGHNYMYTTTIPGEIKVILNHPYCREKAVTYGAYKPLLDRTLVLEKYDDWKRHRKIFAHNFSQRALNNLVGVFYTKSCSLVQKLKNKDMKIGVDLFREFTLVSITDSFSGHDQRLSREERFKITRNLHILEMLVGKKVYNPFYAFDLIYYLTPDGKTARKTVDETIKVIIKVIQRKRENLKKITDSAASLEDLPLLESLIRNEEKLQDDEISINVLFFIIASVDTSASAILFTLILLGMHPKIQERVYQEVIETVGLNGPITHKDLPNLKYTEMVVYESLRLFPSIPVIGRAVSRDLDIGGKTIPAGVNAMISIFDMHRDEKYWKNPKIFDPDRFLPNEVGKRNPYLYLPFSSGPKNCIGWKYALMIIKTTLANVLRSHRIHSNYKLVDEINLESSPVLRTAGDVDLSFTLR